MRTILRRSSLLGVGLLVSMLVVGCASTGASTGSTNTPSTADAPSPGTTASEAEPEAADAEPKAADAYARGLEAFATGELEQAVDLLETALASAPDDLLVGTDYRQAVIALADSIDPRRGDVEAPYERALTFFEQVVADHPDAANAHLNRAFAHVDKIPSAGAITQVILANTAVGHFTDALEREETWLGFYSRGHAYLFWPPVFGRVDLGVADLEKALEIAEATDNAELYTVNAWSALGDGYWRRDDVEGARAIWQRALERFPDHPDLVKRLAFEERDALDAFLTDRFDGSRRVATHLQEIYGDRLAPWRTEDAAE
ncbi:MAG: tetratricopeptide repeat protein [Acidobacteriota bacterium]